MSLKEFIEAITRYVAKALSECFTGKIVLTINVHKGGIGNVQVSLNHELNKENPVT